MANDIHELRELLFGSIRELKAGRMDAEQARAISDLTGRVIDTAKVEIEACRMMGGLPVGFVAAQAAIVQEPRRPALEAVRSAPGASLGRAVGQ